MISIERAKIGDAAAILQLLQRQFEEHAIPFSPDTLAKAVRKMLADQRLGFFLIARDADPSAESDQGTGQAIGLAVVSFAWTLEHDGRSAWLDELYVLPEKRSAGVGGALLDEVLSQAASAGCRAIDLEVGADRRRAERLYRRKGFQPLARSRWVRRLA